MRLQQPMIRASESGLAPWSRESRSPETSDDGQSSVKTSTSLAELCRPASHFFFLSAYLLSSNASIRQHPLTYKLFRSPCRSAGPSIPPWGRRRSSPPLGSNSRRNVDFSRMSRLLELESRSWRFRVDGKNALELKKGGQWIANEVLLHRSSLGGIIKLFPTGPRCSPVRLTW